MMSVQRGHLILVVGPSGGGKDALLCEAKRRLSDESRIAFVQRVITRAVTGTGEAHEEATADDFERDRRAGRFGLSWFAHGLGYGIPSDKFDVLEHGASLVANASRTIIEEARQSYDPTRVILVTACDETLRTRLQSRGRETEAQINSRLARAAKFQPSGDDVVELENEGSLLSSAESFVSLLKESIN